MFSEEIMEKIIMDDRMRSVPFEYQSTVLNVVQSALMKRFLAEKPNAKRDEILNEICRRD